MNPARFLLALCRGDSARIAPALEERRLGVLLICAVTIVLGCGLYGGVVGLWRAPEQALFTAVKMPLLIFLTCGGNALLNGLLAQVLGTGLGFRQTSMAILMSFTIAALILAALSPVAWFILLNTPPLASAAAPRQCGTDHRDAAQTSRATHRSASAEGWGTFFDLARGRRLARACGLRLGGGDVLRRGATHCRSA